MPLEEASARPHAKKDATALSLALRKSLNSSHLLPGIKYPARRCNLRLGREGTPQEVNSALWDKATLQRCLSHPRGCWRSHGQHRPSWQSLLETLQVALLSRGPGVPEMLRKGLVEGVGWGEYGPFKQELCARCSYHHKSVSPGTTGTTLAQSSCCRSVSKPRLFLQNNSHCKRLPASSVL